MSIIESLSGSWIGDGHDALLETDGIYESNETVSAFITNTYDNNGRMLGTYLYNSSASALDSSVYTYNVGNQRASVTRTGENAASYTYDPIGQVIGDQASEVSGGTSRSNEQLHYVFDPAGNLTYRTNNALVQRFQVNTVNELTSNTNGGTLSTTIAKTARRIPLKRTAAGVENLSKQVARLTAERAMILQKTANTGATIITLEATREATKEIANVVSEGIETMPGCPNDGYSGSVSVSLTSVNSVPVILWYSPTDMR